MTNLKQYVEFLYPGILFPESEIREVSDRDSLIDAPKNCFAYQFFERQETNAEDGEVLLGKPKNYSGRFYFGKLKTLEDVKKETPEARTLISNMESNNWNPVVLTRRGNYQPFGERDQIVSD